MVMIRLSGVQFQNWKTRSENNNLSEMYLRIKEEKQIITKEGSSTKGVI